MKGDLPVPMSHLGDKADLTPSPLKGSGSNRGCLTGETNDVVRCYVCALTEQASVTRLMPRRNHCSPKVVWEFNGAERNRTAVRDIGVDHLVHLKIDIAIFTVLLMLGRKILRTFKVMTLLHRRRQSIA